MAIAVSENEIKRQIAGNEQVIKDCEDWLNNLDVAGFDPEYYIGKLTALKNAKVENNVLRWVLEGRQYKGDK